MDSLEVVTHEEWADLQVPDAYYTHAYCELAAIPEDDVDEICLLRYKTANGAAYMPLLIRRIQGGRYYDATSPYGYSGPWVEGTSSLDEFFEKYDEWARARSIVATFVRFHPLLDNAPSTTSTVMPIEVGPTAQWNTEGGRDLLVGMSKGHRKTLRRALRAGVTSRVRLSPGPLSEFRTIYEQSMSRAGADGYYLFPEEYWEHLSKLKEPLPVQFDALHEGETIASILALRYGHYLHVHLSGTTATGRTLGAATACRYAAAQWAQRNRIERMHSGGGVGGSASSLLEWKRKFDEESPLATFKVAKIIHDRNVHARLSIGRSSTSFFPPWRERN